MSQEMSPADRVRAALDDPSSTGFPARWAKALEIALEALEREVEPEQAKKIIERMADAMGGRE